MTRKVSKKSAIVDGHRITLGISVRVTRAGMRTLTALARADGRTSIEDWAAWHMNEVDVDPETLACELAEWSKLGRLQLAMSLVNNAFGESSPWDNGTFRWKEPAPTTEREFLRQAREWATPCADDGGPDHVGEKMMACAKAALRGDGATVHRLASDVQKEWGME